MWPGEAVISIWDGIEEYISVVETGSFTAAADQLGASKSFVSKRVSELETRLGVQLLKRTTRQVSMTAIGERFYASCRDMRRSLASASHEAAQMQQTPTGKLKVSLNDTLTSTSSRRSSRTSPASIPAWASRSTRARAKSI